MLGLQRLDGDAPPCLHEFHAFHSLLLRTLETYIDRKLSPTQVELGALLAVLPRLPLSPASSDRFDILHEKLRQFVVAFNWDAALSCEQQHHLLELAQTNTEEAPSTSRAFAAKCRTRRRSRRVRSWCLRESGGESDGEERPAQRRKKSVNVSECVLLSDTDGFAAQLGDFPAPDNEIEKDSIASSSLYRIYKALFGVYPTYFSRLESLLNALNLLTAIAAFSSVPATLDFFSQELSVEKRAPSVDDSEPLCLSRMSRWLNWMSVSRLTSASIIQLVRLNLEIVEVKEGSVSRPSQLLLSHLRRLCELAELLRVGVEAAEVPPPPRAVHSLTNTIEEAILFVCDKGLAVGVLHEDRASILSQIVDTAVSWLDASAAGGQWAPVFLSVLERRLRPSSDNIVASRIEGRILFEMAVSLLASASDSMVERVLEWLAHLPPGFCAASAGGSELVIALLPFFDTKQQQCVKVLSLHLEALEWRCCHSPTTSLGSASTDDPFLLDDSTPTKAALRLAAYWRTHADCDRLLLFPIFEHMSSTDLDVVLMEGVIPLAEKLSLALQERLHCEDEEQKPPAEVGNLPEFKRHLLQVLEVFAFELKTRNAAGEVVSRLLRPFCDVYMEVAELQDVLVGVLLKATQLNIQTTIECGLVDWQLHHLELSLRSASGDIWTFVEDSASRFFHPLLALLVVARDMLEEPVEELRPYHARFVSLSSRLLGLCLEWAAAPSSLYRNTSRIADLLAVSLSTHLMLHMDTQWEVLSGLWPSVLAATVRGGSALFVALAVDFLMERSISRRCCLEASRLSIDRTSEAEDGTKYATHLNVKEALDCGSGALSAGGRRAIVHPGLVVHTIRLLATAVHGLGGLSPNLLFAVKRLASQLRALERNSDEELQWLPELFNVADSLLLHGYACPSSAIQEVLSACNRLIVRQPHSRHLARFVAFFNSSHANEDIKMAVLSELEALLSREAAAPTESLVFPQMVVADGDGCEDDESPSYAGDAPASVKGRGLGSSSAVTRFRRLFQREAAAGAIRAPSFSAASSSNPSAPVRTLSASLDAAAAFSLDTKNGVRAVDGVAISAWIRHDHAPRNEAKMLHVFSLTCEPITATLTMHTRRGQLQLTIHAGDKQIMRSKVGRQLCVSPSSSWHHLVFGIRLSPSGVLRVQIGVDEALKEIDAVILERLPSDAPSASLSIHFGAISRRLQPHYFLSSFFGFRGLLTHAHSLVLAALGPQLSSLAETKVEHLSPCMGWAFSSGGVTSSLRPSVEMAIADTDRILLRLQRQQAFVVRASSAFAFGACEQPADVDAAPGIASALSISLLADEQIAWRSLLVRAPSRSLYSALSPLGSLKLLLLLFAKTVNDSLPGPAQRTALRMLLRASRLPLWTASDRSQLRLEASLSRILTSSLAVLNRAMIDTILDHCIARGDGEVKDYESREEVDGKGDEGMSMEPAAPFKKILETDERSNDVIRDAKLLLWVSCCSELWTGGRRRESAWRHLISVLAGLVDESLSAAADFNRFQLSSADALRRIVHVCLKLSSISPSGWALGSNEEASLTVRSLLMLLSSLLGEPARYEAVLLLWHLVFLSHPASASFINQSIIGHNHWLKIEVLQEGNEGEVTGDSALSLLLQRYIKVFGRAELRARWSEDVLSLFDIRREYDERMVDLEGSEEHRESVGSADLAAQTGGELPDLLSDLNLPRGKSNTNISGVSGNGSGRNSSEKTTAASDGSEQAEWVVALRAGVMQQMAVLLQNCPDGLLQCLVHDALSWQAIIVLLTRQKEQRIRDAAMAMLEKFLLRVPLFTKMNFIQCHGFPMLASQLRGGTVSANMADSLFGIMCGETVRLGDGLDESHVAALQVDRISCGCLQAIFVLFLEAIPDISLFWNITNALIKIFEVSSQLQAAMADSKLGDVMVNALQRIARLPPSSTDIYSASGDITCPQLECWINFAQRIVITSVPFNDFRMNAMCERFVWLLSMADWHAAAAASAAATHHESEASRSSALRGHFIVRAQVCKVLHCWMESMRTVFSNEGRSASAASSVDSLGSVQSSPTEEYDFCEDLFTAERAHLVDGTSPVAAFVAGSFANLRERIAHIGPVSRSSLRCEYRRREGAAPLATLEALEKRILFCLQQACALFSVHPQTAKVSEEENNLFHFTLYFMLSSWGRANKKIGESVWLRLVSCCREKVGVFLAQLVAFILFPAQTKLADSIRRRGGSPCWLDLPVDEEWADERRAQLVKALSHELLFKENLCQLLNVNLDYECALCLGIYELALLSPPLSSDVEKDVAKMLLFLRSTKVGSPLGQLSPEALNNMSTDEVLTMHSYSQHRKAVLKQMRSKLQAILDEELKACGGLEDVAMATTCEIVEELGTPRRMMLDLTKENLLQLIQAEDALDQITRELCHPEGAGFSSRVWPRGEAVDPTEGPYRERRRLTPAYYNIEPRFFEDGVRELVAANVEEHPLEHLLRGERVDGGQRGRVIGLGVELYLDATVLRGTFECSGELLLAENSMHFSGDRARSTQKGSDCPTITLSWRFDQIVEIHMRNHLLKDVAIEIFLVNGDTYLIVFPTTEKRAQLKQFLLDKKLPFFSTPVEQQQQAAMLAWRHGALSNFDYLMQLNKFAGRSFNDLMQYPVFPFILADYRSAVLDLTKTASFRCFSRPMAVQDVRMEEHYAANYACLEAECSKTRVKVGPLHFGPYHYGSHYSNSGIVVHYLVRLPPFTQIALEYQDNNFDIPDRLFNSIEATWRLASSESTTDFKELIPEFFFMHEFLTNRQRLEMGVRQGGEKVGDVKLPVWVPPNNPRLFVLIHRQALESSYVTSNIHHWIDLIFGQKQQGPAALKALNVFHPATYVGRLDADELADELSQSALRTMVRSYGQMPIQLMTVPHQPHLGGIRRPDVACDCSPLPTVLGLRWGDYVGSPEVDASQLQVVLSSPRVTRIQQLADGVALGLPDGNILMSPNNLADQQEAATRTGRGSSECLWLLSWSFHDAVVRIRPLRPQLRPWINCIHLGAEENQVRMAEFSAAHNLIFVALTGGVIKVFEIGLESSGEIRRLNARSELLAHQQTATALVICDEFCIAFTACSAGKAVLWDTNRLSYVRTLCSDGGAVTAAAISKTSGDVAIVTQRLESTGSVVRLFTLNGESIGTIQTEVTVTAIAMTNQPEGTAVNAVALALADGHIRLVEMWCLTTIRDIFQPAYSEAIISVEFAAGGRKLFAALSSGRVLCWQNVSSMHRGRTAAFQVIDPFV